MQILTPMFLLIKTKSFNEFYDGHLYVVPFYLLKTLIKLKMHLYQYIITYFILPNKNFFLLNYERRVLNGKMFLLIISRLYWKG